MPCLGYLTNASKKLQSVKGDIQMDIAFFDCLKPTLRPLRAFVPGAG